MSGITMKRPTPITVVAVLWLFIGIYNLWTAFQGISSDVGAWDLLSNPLIHEWVKMAIPTELALNIAVLIAALFQLISVPALLTGKSWSYKLALGVPAAIAILNIVFGALYATVPAEISYEELTSTITTFFAAGIFQMVMVFFFWSYLNKPEVQVFLGRLKPDAAIQKTTPIPDEEVMVEKERTFYCRYCGAQNETDAVFCEKCGKQLKTS